MGGTCGMYVGMKKYIQGFGVGYLSERSDLEDLAVGGRFIIEWILRKRDEGCGLDLSGPG
jgi:hypothetical protein